MSVLTSGVDYWALAWPRFVQGLGVGFIFVPLNAVGLATIPRISMGNATALLNVVRNLGGGAGVAVVSMLLARRTQEHQSTLVPHVNPFDAETAARLSAWASHFGAHGADSFTAQQRALARVYQELTHQAQVLAFADDFWLLFVLFFGTVLLLPLLERVSTGPATWSSAPCDFRRESDADRRHRGQPLALALRRGLSAHPVRHARRGARGPPRPRRGGGGQAGPRARRAARVHRLPRDALRDETGFRGRPRPPPRHGGDRVVPSRPGPPVHDGEAHGPERGRGEPHRGQGSRAEGLRGRGVPPALFALRGPRAPDARRGALRPALAPLLPSQPAHLGALPGVGLSVDARPRAGGRRLPAQPGLSRPGSLSPPHRRGGHGDGGAAQRARPRAAGGGFRLRAPPVDEWRAGHHRDRQHRAVRGERQRVEDRRARRDARALPRRHDAAHHRGGRGEAVREAGRGIVSDGGP